MILSFVKVKFVLTTFALILLAFRYLEALGPNAAEGVVIKHFNASSSPPFVDPFASSDPNDKGSTPPPYLLARQVFSSYVADLHCSSGKARATTTVNTKVKWGTRFHLLTVYYTREELCNILEYV